MGRTSDGQLVAHARIPLFENEFVKRHGKRQWEYRHIQYKAERNVQYRRDRWWNLEFFRMGRAPRNGNCVEPSTAKHLCGSRICRRYGRICRATSRGQCDKGRDENDTNFAGDLHGNMPHATVTEQNRMITPNTSDLCRVGTLLPTRGSISTLNRVGTNLTSTHLLSRLQRHSRS